MNSDKLYSEIKNEMLELYGDKLNQIILYGSFARNEQTIDSDIDFMVLVNDNEENLRKNREQIADIMTRLSLEFNLLVSITEEISSRFEDFSEILPFYKNVLAEGIKIYGE
jgi:uncharacterized protein